MVRSASRLIVFRILLLLLMADCGVRAAAQTTVTARLTQPPRPHPLIQGKRILVLGDSITAAGSYVSFIEYYLTRQSPDRPTDIISIGLASETLSGLTEKQHPFPRPCLFERLDRALEMIKPEIVIACYGMNDGIYHPQDPARFKAFQDGVQKLVAAAAEAKAPLILLTPPPFDPLPITTKTLEEGSSDYGFKTPYRHYDAVLSEYARWEMGLDQHGAFVVDLNRSLTRMLTVRRRTLPSFTFAAKDGIHPDMLGHLLMARSVLRALQIPYDHGDPEKVLAVLQDDPLFKMIDAHRRTRSMGWLNYVGYTRGETVRAKEIAPAEAKAGALLRKAQQYARDNPTTPALLINLAATRATSQTTRQ